MCLAGVFEPETNVELIRGEIVDMPPPGPEHEFSTASLHWVFSRAVGGNVYIWPQGNAIRLPNSNSRPQPDIALLRWRDDLYRGKSPTAEDVILLVEVAYKSLKYDLSVKLSLYAEAGIPEYWVVNLVDIVVEVYSNPAKGKYQAFRKIRRSEMLPLPAELQGSIAASDILGPDA